MPSIELLPKNISLTLNQLQADRIEDIQRIRDGLVRIAVSGMSLLPEFTLHNATHSDNLVFLIGELSREFGLKLTGYEAFLFAAAAYVHDLGMFFDGARFEQKILPDPKAALSFCPVNRCDTIAEYQILGKDLDAQIRETHSLLSAYWLEHEITRIDGITAHDRPYLMALSRAHRKVNLREIQCDCYAVQRHDGESIRMGVLASLLRIVDAMDFFSNRAPIDIFGNRATTFLENPDALVHWLKHYFVQDPHITRVNRGGNIYLDCTVHFSVPPKTINGNSYAKFFRPLFEEHIQRTRKTDLNITNYPPDLFISLNANRFRLTLEEHIIAGGRALPIEIEQAIVDSGCATANEFIDQLKPLPVQTPTNKIEIPSQPVLIIDDNAYFTEGLCSLLEKEGYNCKVAHTFEAGKEKLLDLPFVLILDVKLHNEVDSWKVLARVAAEYGIPIILATGYPSFEGANEALREFGVIHYFSKGNLDNLLAKIAEAAHIYWVKKGKPSLFK